MAPCWYYNTSKHSSSPVELLVLFFPGLCSCYMYISYVFRFTSAWIIVAFTVERYIGICKPLDKRVFGPRRRSFALRSLGVVALIGVVVSGFKPFTVAPQQQRSGKVSMTTLWVSLLRRTKHSLSLQTLGNFWKTFRCERGLTVTLSLLRTLNGWNHNVILNPEHDDTHFQCTCRRFKLSKLTFTN